MLYQTVKVGVTVIIMAENHILLAKRKGSHGEGTWDTPGGHLDPGETIIQCAERETLEETGLILDAAHFIELGFTEDFFEKENKHYISCVVACQLIKSNVRPLQKEPHKFSTDWLWCEMQTLPTPLFIPIQNALLKWPQQLLG